MNTDPNNIDLSKLTIQQLRQLKIDLVNQRMTMTGSDWTTCWNQCAILYPKIWAATPAISPIPENSQRLAMPAQAIAPKSPPPMQVDTNRLANPFQVAGLGNDMDQKAVRATYADALKKHLHDQPNSTPIEAHSAVMKAHPALAAAMRKKKTSAQNDTDGDPDGGADASASDDDTLANSVALAACRT